jgi:thiamine biosynthesis lipoprotein
MRPEHRFRAMGLDVVVRAADVDANAVRALLDETDRTFSRFRDDSELVRVNAAPTPFVHVSARFARAVGTALAACDATGGAVDPTLGRAIVAAGYDRDFAALAPDGRPLGATEPGRRGEVALAGRLLHRPPGVLLDLDGVVKGMLVDELLELTSGDAVVSAGGDVSARGPADVAVPGGPPVRILGGGLATSGSTRRRWLRGGAWQHHLIDPRTGRPSTSRWTSATVAAGSCTAADVAAKAAFLLGDDGPDWLTARGLSGQLVDADGVVVETSGWRREAVAA